MKIRITWFLILILAMSMLLRACGNPAAAEDFPVQEQVETEIVEPTDAFPEPIEEPEPTAVQPATEIQLDEAYAPFLA